MQRWIGAAALAAVLAFATGAEAEGKSKYKYIGLKKCGKCHGKELMGDQVSPWEKGPHAKAIEVLKSEEAIAVAAEKGLALPPHEAAECLRCHATAQGLTEDQLYKKKPLKVSNGVQCESCHGPASGYKSNKTMSDREKSLAKGMWEPGKNAEICQACHNDESPTFEPGSFDYEAAKEEIAHPIPEDVKGRYLEIVRERRKAARGGGDDEDDDEEEEEED